MGDRMESRMVSLEDASEMAEEVLSRRERIARMIYVPQRSLVQRFRRWREEQS